MTKQLVMCAAIVVFATGAAFGQDATPPGLLSLAGAASHATLDADRPSPQPRQTDAPEEKGTWDNIKRGFYTGLALGGLVGVALVADCGHPECGPLLTLAAGVGGAIGLGIDALFDQRDRQRPVAGGSAHGVARRPVPAGGPRVMVRFKKSW